MTKRITQLAFPFLFFLMLIVASSCERPALIDFPPHTPLLVLHGYVAVGDTIKVSLGKTIRITVSEGDTATYVDNGWVLLYENDIFVDSLKFNPHERRYISSHVIAQTGNRYKVMAGAPGFGIVEAAARGPLPVPTTSLKVTDSSRTNTLNIMLSDIQFRFLDPAQEMNYYLLELYLPGGSFDNCVYTYEPVIERYKGDMLPFDQNSCIYGDEVLFNDRSFNGQQKELTISSATDLLQSFIDPTTNITYRPYLKRYNISEDYYRYFKTWTAIEFNTGNVTMASPVIIKGNVHNGYGLFTVYTVTTDSLP